MDGADPAPHDGAAEPAPAARSCLQHGVLLDLFSLGVFITGEAGVGKSELALELLDRGHRLVADDCVVFRRTRAGAVVGVSPPPLRGFLALRSLGIIDVERTFGRHRLAAQAKLGLVLVLDTQREPAATDPLRGARSRVQVLDRWFPCATLPARDERRLALLAETAVRDFRQRRAGRDAAATLVARQGDHRSVDIGE